jgi:cytochrome c oxidase subunit 2
MFYFGYTSFRELRDIPENPFTVKVTARMWKFDFEYLNGKKSDTLYVPVNTAIDLEMQSMDVNHAFYIPAFRIKEDIIHGTTNHLYFVPRETGDFDIACAEYCGLNHSAMYTKVKVIYENDFKKWYGGEWRTEKEAIKN